MKKLVIGFTFLSLSLNAFALDLHHTCKESFDAQHVSRTKKVGRLYDIYTLLLFPTIIGPMFTLISAGNIQGLDIRSELLNDSLGLSQSSEDEIKEHVIEKALPHLQSKRARRLSIMNQERARIGYPDLSIEEFEKVQPIQVEIDRILPKTPLKLLLELVNKAGNTNILYETLKNYLADKKDTDHFCQNGQVIKLNKKGLRKLAAEIVQ